MNKKILLVGGCGFIGHNLALHLKKSGCLVSVVDSLSVNNVLSFTDSDIKNKKLYVTVGERGQGMIAQDASKHPGSIIRINLDGSVPKDNPKFKNKKKWLPEIFQIGLRNPQGMALSPFDNKIYL